MSEAMWSQLSFLQGEAELSWGSRKVLLSSIANVGGASDMQV